MSRPRTPLEAAIDAACGIKPGEEPPPPEPRDDLASALAVLRGEPHCTTKEGIDIWALDRPERDALLTALRMKGRRS